MKDIGERIREQRKKNGITQEAMAKALGVTAQAVSKWENGQNAPDISMIMPICGFLGIGADELLGGNRQKELEEKYWEHMPLGDEFVLVVCEEALKEFPDDTKWLERRFLANKQIVRACINEEKNIKLRIQAYTDVDEQTYCNPENDIKKSRHLNKAYADIRELIRRVPENESYKYWLAEIYVALGMKEQAKKILYKSEITPLPSLLDYRNTLLSGCLEGDELIQHKQSVLQQACSAFFVALRDYNTLESLAFADELIDKYYKDDADFSSCRWILDTLRARIYLNEDNITEYVRYMTSAYDKAKRSDSLDRDGLYSSPFLDRVMHHKSPVPEFEQYIFINDFSSDALYDLKCRIVAENMEYPRIVGYDWQKLVKFLNDKGRKTPRYLNFSSNHDTTREEWDEYHITFEDRAKKGNFSQAEHTLMLMNMTKKLMKQHRLTGFMITLGGNFPVGFCNCGDREKYKLLGIRREPVSLDDQDLFYTAEKLDTVPKGSKVFSIVDMAVHSDFRWCGIEKKLIQETCDWAKRCNYEYVEAYIDTALLFMLKGDELDRWLAEYKKAGFEIVKDLSEDKYTKLVLQKKI